MELGDVQGLEIVVRRFNFRALDDGKADGKENIFDFLKNLTNQMVRANGTKHAGEGEVDALLGACGGFRACFDDGSSLLENNLDVLFEVIQRFSDCTL
jgi:hypothetical protein